MEKEAVTKDKLSLIVILSKAKNLTLEQKKDVRFAQHNEATTFETASIIN